MKQTIIISEKNAARIMQVFQQAQGKATVRTIDSYEELASICESVEKRVGVTKKALTGTIVEYNFRQGFPAAYKYHAESTHFRVKYNGHAWELEIKSVYRDFCPKKPRNWCGYPYCLTLSNTAKEAVLLNYI